MHCPRCGAQLREDQISCSQCGYLEDVFNQDKKKQVKLEPVKNDSGPELYAGFWRRGGALILDGLILIAGQGLLASVISGVIMLMAFVGGHQVDFQVIGSFAGGFGFVFALGTNWIYFTWLESSRFQATLGKKIMGLIVQDLHNQPITFGQANVRYWGKFFSGLILLGGFWMMNFMKKKQTLHDKMAGTIVLKHTEQAQARVRKDISDTPMKVNAN